MYSLLQGCVKQAATVLESVAATTSPVSLTGGGEGSSGHVQPVLLGDVVPQTAHDRLKKSQQHAASSHLLSSSTAESVDTTGMATAAMPPAVQVC